MRLFITNRFVNFEGLFYGDKSGLQGVLGPLLKVTNASLVMAQQGGWLDQVKHFGNGVSLDQGHPYSMVISSLFLFTLVPIFPRFPLSLHLFSFIPSSSSFSLSIPKSSEP